VDRRLSAKPELPIVRTADAQFVHLPLANVWPDPAQPRKQFSQEELRELAESIRAKGVIEPIVVRPDPSGHPQKPAFLIIAGERRYLASRSAGQSTIPAIVRHKLSARDVLEIQIIENLQRASLDPLDEAAGYQRLATEFQEDTASIAKKIGKSVRYVQARLQLLKVDGGVRQELERGTISADTALRLHAQPLPERSQALADIKRHADATPTGRVSVRAADAIIEKINPPAELDHAAMSREEESAADVSRRSPAKADAGRVNDKDVEWLTHCPASDVNFTYILSRANLATVAMALYKLPAKANQTVKAKLESAHRRLKREFEAQRQAAQTSAPASPSRRSDIPVATPVSPAKPSGAQVKLPTGWLPATLGAVAQALHAGRAVKLPKNANAVRVVYEVEKIVLATDLDTLRNAGVPLRVEFGKCPVRGNRVAQRKSFAPL
jgi:ParB family chromosome partitioning protein